MFDFAGGEVRMTEEVNAASKEAKSFFKQNEGKKKKQKQQANIPLTLPSLPARLELKRSRSISSF